MKMIVAGKVNVDLCAPLRAAGSAGPSGCTISCRRTSGRRASSRAAAPTRSTSASSATSTAFDLTLLERCSTAATCRSSPASAPAATAPVYNINADIVANQLAGALAADALVLVTDAPGVLRDVDDPASRIPRLTVAGGQARHRRRRRHRGHDPEARGVVRGPRRRARAPSTSSPATSPAQSASPAPSAPCSFPEARQNGWSRGHAGVGYTRQL